jgi:hypothetical protein
MNEMGRREERNDRRKIIVSKSYKIIYLDRSTVKTEKIIDVREEKINHRVLLPQEYYKDIQEKQDQEY